MTVPSSHEVGDGAAVQGGDAIGHVPVEPHLEQALYAGGMHLLVELLDPLAAPGDLFRGCAAAAQHRQGVLDKGAGPGRLAEEGGPALRRLMEPADQIGVVLEVVGDIETPYPTCRPSS